MTLHQIEWLAWLASAAMIVTAGLGFREAMADDDGERLSAAYQPARNPSAPDSALLRESAEGIVARDPFRLDRVPADVRFDPDPAPAPPEAPPRPSVVAPVLRGITGPPWQALLEGLPGHERAVVARVGSVFGELVVSHIGRDTVIVQAPDTSFTLTVRRVWR